MCGPEIGIETDGVRQGERDRMAAKRSLSRGSEVRVLHGPPTSSGSSGALELPEIVLGADRGLNGCKKAAVASAPAAVRVRVWQITSWGRGPRGGQALPEGASVDFYEAAGRVNW